MKVDREPAADDGARRPPRVVVAGRRRVVAGPGAVLRWAVRVSRVPSLLLLLTASVSGPIAHAQAATGGAPATPYRALFDAAPVCELVGGERPRLMLVARDAAAREAAAALGAVLDARGCVTAVVDDLLLGEHPDGGEAAIARRAAELPREWLAPVDEVGFVTAARSSAADSACVSLYSRAGAPLRQLTVGTGHAPQLFVPPAAAPARPAPTPLSVEQWERRRDAEGRLQRMWLTVETSHEEHDAPAVTWAGKGPPIDEPTLYHLVGRDDLWGKARARRIVKPTLLSVGAALAAAGAAMVIGAWASPSLDRFDCQLSSADGGCSRWAITNGRTALWASGVIALAASIPHFVVGGVISSDPIRPRELARLVDERNRQLAASLGLSR